MINFGAKMINFGAEMINSRPEMIRGICDRLDTLDHLGPLPRHSLSP